MSKGITRTGESVSDKTHSPSSGRSIHSLPGKHIGQLECPGDMGASLSQCKPSKRESEEEAATLFMK